MSKICPRCAGTGTDSNQEACTHCKSGLARSERPLPVPTEVFEAAMDAAVNVLKPAKPEVRRTA